jgi:hypothetical protein
MKPRYKIYWLTSDGKPYTHGNLQGKSIMCVDLSNWNIIYK